MYSLTTKSKLLHCRISPQGLSSYSICYVVSLKHSCATVFSGLNIACPNNLCNKKFCSITYAITIQATTRGSCCMVMSRNMHLLARFPETFFMTILPQLILLLNPHLFRSIVLQEKGFLSKVSRGGSHLPA